MFDFTSHRRHARSRVTYRIHELTVKERLPIEDAAKRVLRDPQHEHWLKKAHVRDELPTAMDLVNWYKTEKSARARR